MSAMFNPKASFIIKTASLTALLTAYLIATLFRSEAWGNILSPIVAFSSAGLLLLSYLSSARAIKVRVTLLLFALGCAAWGTADTVWAVVSFSGGTPDDSMVLQGLYVLTNCFFVLSLLMFAVKQFRKWYLVQFGIDLFVTGFLSIMLFWILFLQKDPESLKHLLASDFTSVLSILTDVIICICILSWVLSVREGKIPGFLRIISTGLFLFSITDLLYYYLSYNDLYFPNTLIDFLYIVDMVVIAFGALCKTNKDGSSFDLSIVTNIGNRRRWIYLLLYPAIIAAGAVTGFARVEVRGADYFALGGPILFYWAACKYVQVSLEKEALLKRSNESLERLVAEQVCELSFLANQDTLTTLFNRRYFLEQLDNTISSKRTNETVGLLLIDMDRFKTINDTYGHDVGDKVLIDLSYRFIEWNNYGATVARLGGDEFAIMFAGRYTQKDFEDFCSEIIKFCSLPFSRGESRLSITVSIGIAIASAEVCDGKTLMQNADIAMYRAKAQGYNRYLVYDQVICQDYRKSAEIEVLLRQADPDKDFELFYQPQYALPSKKLIGAEALLRWKTHEHGYIPPNVFIPIAEQIDYIHAIGKWVMRETIRQSVVWNSHYDLPLKVGFNISPKQFKDDSFTEHTIAAIKDSGICPGWLDVEVTESIMMDDEGNAGSALSAFRELGVTVSIDDFGSGYSALGNLNKFAFDRIKIDKTLVDSINSREISGSNVVRAAINMAHASGIQAIAEGVETYEQLEILTELGCDQVQGFLLGRPVPADVFQQRYMRLPFEDVKIS